MRRSNRGYQHQGVAIRSRDPFQLRCSDAGIWYVHWSEGRRSKRRSTRLTDQVAAYLYARKWFAQRGTITKGKGMATCSDIWALYVRDHVETKCVGTERHMLAWKQLKGRFGELLPLEVTYELIQQHVRARRPAKASTVFVELSLLVASWRYGVRRRRLDLTDLPDIQELDLPLPPLPRERWLREWEVDRLFEIAAEMRQGLRLSRLERFMHLALNTGGRRTALLELQWDQVDFEARVIHQNPPGRRQTTKKRSSVPISDDLMSVLHRAHAERISNYVVDHPRRMPDALKRLGLRAGVHGVTHHVFRHTAATWMARRGGSLWQIAKVLGNTVEEVERTYAKHAVDDLLPVVNLIRVRKESGPLSEGGPASVVLVSNAAT